MNAEEIIKWVEAQPNISLNEKSISEFVKNLQITRKKIGEIFFPRFLFLLEFKQETSEKSCLLKFRVTIRFPLYEKDYANRLARG